MNAVAYSARQIDLYDPSREAKFFEQPPQSEAALCAEMARLAYCRPLSSFEFDRPRVLEALEKAGFTSCRFFESREDQIGSLTLGKKGGGTNCFVAVRNDAAQKPSLAVVSFRGTDSEDLEDLITDANFIFTPWTKGGRVHQGFAGALSHVSEAILREIGSLSCRVLFTGHSLGAALATLLASLHAPAALYTFGSPRVGDQAFTATLAGVKNYRFVDCADIVARVPLKIMNFAHAGDPFYIEAARNISFNPGSWFMWRDRTWAATRYFLQEAWRRGNVGARQLADHAPVNYVSAVNAAPDPVKQN